MSTPIHPDDIDREILRILQKDGSLPKAEIARQVGLTPTAVFERIRKLEERGVVCGYTIVVDPKAVGMRLLAFVFVSEIKPVKAGKTGQRLATLENVEEVHRVAGKDCFVLKVRAEAPESLTAILDRIGAIESVGNVQTTIVLESFLERAFSLNPHE